MITPATRSGFVFTLSLLIVVVSGCQPQVEEVAYDSASDSLRYDGEGHIRNIQQVTFGGNNAEAYWSFDDEQLVFQSDWSAINGQGCDQI